MAYVVDLPEAEQEAAIAYHAQREARIAEDKEYRRLMAPLRNQAWEERFYRWELQKQLRDERYLEQARRWLESNGGWLNAYLKDKDGARIRSSLLSMTEGLRGLSRMAYEACYPELYPKPELEITQKDRGAVASMLKAFVNEKRNDLSAEAIAEVLGIELFPVELVAKILEQLKVEGHYDDIVGGDPY